MTRTDLIVPIRDRRQGKRIVTLKNIGRFMIAIAVVFAALTFQSEFRRGTTGGDYGRLLGTQVTQKNDVAKPKFDIVKEAPVPDQTAADPTLVEAGVRSQYLTADQIGGTPAPAPVTTPAPAPVAAASAAPVGGSGDGVSIVGGTGGVTIVRGGQRQPTLSGGIFKQQQ